MNIHFGVNHDSIIFVGTRKGSTFPMSRLGGRAEPWPEDQDHQRAEAFPDVSLLGITPKEKAIIAMWDRRVEMEGFASVIEAIRNTVPGLKDRAIVGPHNYDQIRL